MRAFPAYLWVGLTNGKGAAVFVNFDDTTIAFELLNTITLVYQWKGFRKPEEIITVTLPDSILSKYIGEYINGGYYSEIKKEKMVSISGPMA